MSIAKAFRAQWAGLPATVGAMAVAVWALAPGAHATTLNSQDMATYGAAFDAIDAGNPASAVAIAQNGTHPTAQKIILWLALADRDYGAGFQDLAAFISANPNWPRLDTLRRRAEEVMASDMPAGQVVAWFASNPPVSTEGHIRHINALIATGASDAAVSAARTAWVEDDMSANQQTAFLAAFAGYLRADDHIARVDRLLWDEESDQARRMLPLLDPAQGALANARILLMNQLPGVDDAVAAVPEALKSHPGLIYERLRWRRRAGFDDSARELLDLAPYNPPSERDWWVERNILVRNALRDGMISEAYRHAAAHRQTGGVYYLEAEMTAGWLALSFLNEPQPAYGHFQKLYAAAETPISLARGAYWSGRALEALGDIANANQWYGVAAGFPQVYYGQLALAQLNPDAPLILPAGPSPLAPNDVAAFAATEFATAVRVLDDLGEDRLVATFFWAMLQDAETTRDYQHIAALADGMGRIEMAVWAARRAARNLDLLYEGYPVIEVPSSAAAVEMPLIHGLIRQESGFDVGAISPAGARGLMQLMPGTAQHVAAQLGIATSNGLLTSDAEHNIRLGSTYLADRLDQFGGSYIMAAAGYNAGPNRVLSWIDTYGDPRMADVDPIDWVEMIPFRETRNYVQRVLEGAQIYRVRLGEAPTASSILRDLTRGRFQ